MQELFQYFWSMNTRIPTKRKIKIIEYLCNYYPNPNLFVVGGRKAGNLPLSGGDKNFLYFKHLYKEATLINLTKNYRSTQIILDAAHSLNNTTPLRKYFYPKAYFLQQVLKKASYKSAELSSFYEEYYYVAQEIKKK